MAWYNPFSKKPVDVEEKLNPAQYLDGGNVESSREHTLSYERAYEDLEIVNRGVNMIVDDVAAAAINVDFAPLNPFRMRSRGDFEGFGALRVMNKVGERRRLQLI